MGLLAPSVYLDQFGVSVSNVYIAVGQNDITIKTRKIDPYKGTWVKYQAGIWANQTLRDKQTSPISYISNTFTYESTVDVIQQVYSNIKFIVPNTTDC